MDEEEREMLTSMTVKLDKHINDDYHQLLWKVDENCSRIDVVDGKLNELKVNNIKAHESIMDKVKNTNKLIIGAIIVAIIELVQVMLNG